MRPAIIVNAKVFLVPGSDGTCRAVRQAMALGIPYLRVVPSADMAAMTPPSPLSMANASALSNHDAANLYEASSCMAQL